MTSTFPGRRGEATPGFVWDLAEQQARHFETVVPAPRVGDAPRRLIAEFHPDVLHVHWVLPQGLVAALAAPGRRWVLTAHGGMSTPWRGGSPPASNGSPCAARPPSRCRTRRCASASCNSAPILAPRWCAQWAPTWRPSGRRRAERRSGKLLFVGRLAEKKGVAVLLEALRSADLGDDWSLDVVGNGPLRPRLEAIAAGCAIAASWLPGIDAVLVDGHTGLLVPPGDSQALAAALSRLLGDAELRSKLGAAAAATVDAYSIEVVGEQYVELLGNLIAAGVEAGPP